MTDSPEKYARPGYCARCDAVHEDSRPLSVYLSARHAGVSESRVRQWRREGRLPSGQSRFTVTQLDAARATLNPRRGGGDRTSPESRGIAPSLDPAAAPLVRARLEGEARERALTLGAARTAAPAPAAPAPVAPTAPAPAPTAPAPAAPTAPAPVAPTAPTAPASFFRPLDF